ncbi:MAG TPA: hypothetical protein DCE41_35255, partial [Cytophagales bacterium]|nr:hypothetical protein [Cytophagales bacterium]
PASPFPAGDQPVGAVVYNAGTDTLRRITLDWSANGEMQSTLTYTDTLTPGQQDTVLLGNYPFTPTDLVQFQAWTSAPNFQPDPNVQNDTVLSAPVRAGFDGTYTVGLSDSADFTSFTEAITALQEGRVLGPVTIQGEPGVYSEYLYLPPITGVSAENSLTFQGVPGDSSQVVIEFVGTSSNQATVLMEGLSHVAFRDLTLKNSGTSGFVVRTLAHSQHVTFEGCHLELGNTVSTIVYADGNGRLDSLRLEGNRLESGNIGLWLSGYGGGDQVKYPVIRNNVFSAQNARWMYLDEVNYVVIEGNRMEKPQNRDFFGLTLRDLYEGAKITNNDLYIDYRGTAVDFNYCNGSSADTALFASNRIYVGGTGRGRAITIGYSPGWSFFHNSVWSTHEHGSEGHAFYANNSSDLTLRNNIFYQTGGQTAVELVNSTTGLISDHNNFATTGPILVRATVLGDLATLNEWQIQSGQDANSLSENPFFYGSQDLHTRQIALDNAGTPLAEVP